MKQIGISELTDNFFDTIGKEWMIVCAGQPGHYNMMTASWGGIGWLWNKPVAFVFIRPERHTFGFTETESVMTLSFLGHSEEARKIYNFCGAKSGRDVNKAVESGLRPVPVEEGRGVAFEQARLTLVGKKLYSETLKPEAFADPSLVGRWYGAHGGMHKMYVVEITEAFVQENAE